MDNAMVALTAETRSMRLEIAGFQSQISGLDHRVAAVESPVALQTDRDQELFHLRSKLTDLEDRSRRNNICFLGFPEGIEGTDILSYLRDTLPKLADTTFEPPLEFQRTYRLGLKRQNVKDHPHPIIACFLQHGQAHQLLQTSRTQGPLRLGSLEIRLSWTSPKKQQTEEEPFSLSVLAFATWMFWSQYLSEQDLEVGKTSGHLSELQPQYEETLIQLLALRQAITSSE
ncbi:hypothetical protein NDU88_003810 [Pleurodeles waltl]|uniref:Uncharacterized protein n=1 Tax=Pleurodeles waltl TaxID=8319 RepID=A0AAV7UFD5_PLEWA|nr:hypothetical protein NDU88_003810 [Pleurodeles waltl]